MNSREIKNIIVILGILSLFLVFSAYLNYNKPLKTHKKVSKCQNIILITLESTRSDHLSCFGYRRNTTPEICRFANKSLQFKGAKSGGHTAISIPSIMTSYQPYRLDISSHKDYFNETNHMLTALDENSYKTKFMSNTLFEDLNWINFNFKKLNSSSRLNNASINFLNSDSGKKFLWIHYKRNHFPYRPLKDFEGIYSNSSGLNMTIVEDIYLSSQRAEGQNEFIKKFEAKKIKRELEYIKNKYDESLRSVDFTVGKLFERLKEENIFNKSLIILTSDHGESLGEHNRYFIHKGVYEEVLNVPLLISLPQNRNISKKSTEKARLIDILPTVLDYCDLRYEQSDTFDGKSLIGEPRKNKMNRLSVAKYKPHNTIGMVYSIQNASLKYIFNPTTGREELFNLREDPEESHNLMEFGKDKVPKKFLRMKRRITESYNMRKRYQENLSEEMREKINNMGYLR